MGYIRVRESLYTQVIIWINIVLNHIETIVNLPRHEDSCMGYIPLNVIKKQPIKNPMPYWYQKHEFLTIKYMCVCIYIYI